MRPRSRGQLVVLLCHLVDAGLGCSAALRLAVPNMVTRMPRPNAPPTCWVTFTKPEAAPASRESTPARDAAVSGMNATPMPRPSNSIGTTMSGKYSLLAEMRLSQNILASATEAPPTISRFPPTRGISRGTMRTIANSAMVIGRNAIPAWSGLYPRTPCRNWVRKKNMPTCRRRAAGGRGRTRCAHDWRTSAVD